MNEFGLVYRLTSFGESHGAAVGGVVDGVPSGLNLDIEEIQKELDRRKPGQSDIVTPRKEKDRVKILSGLFEGVTTGMPIGFIVENENQHSADYSNIKNAFRPSHADFTYTYKYGIRDYRGGGRSSARETISRVVAGAIAKQALRQMGITITAYTSQVGDVSLTGDYNQYNLADAEKNSVRCPDEETAKRMESLIKSVQKDGDTVGGVVSCVISGCPAGLGEPVFDKLQARLAYAMMGINAAKGFEYGMGFKNVGRRGSEMIDEFAVVDGEVTTATNNSGGIQGGISNGMDIYFNVAFKPVATLLRDVNTIDKDGKETVLRAKGRHDPCVLPRAVPIVEAMAAMVVFDMVLLNRVSKI